MSYLLDTNVISELRKGERTDPGVAAWVERVPRDAIYFSALTIGEIRKGIERKRRSDPATANALERWLETVIEIHSDRILPIDQAIAEQWGRIDTGDPLPVVDGLLAATAQVHGLTLVTRNGKDVARTGVSFVNPFSS